MAKKKSKFMCSSCGYEAAKWMGRCPGCGEWNTMNEEVEVISKGHAGRSSILQRLQKQPLLSMWKYKKKHVSLQK